MNAQKQPLSPEPAAEESIKIKISLRATRGVKGHARDFRTPAKKAILNAPKTLSTNPTSFPKNWQQDIFPYFFGNAFNLQESDFLPLKFERLNGVPCWNQLSCDDSVRPMYAQTFLGLKKIWQVISPLTFIYFVNSIAEALTDAPATLYQLGHSTTPKNTLSKRCYSAPEMSFNDMFRKQNLELKLTLF